MIQYIREKENEHYLCVKACHVVMKVNNSHCCKGTDKISLLEFTDTLNAYESGLNKDTKMKTSGVIHNKENHLSPNESS